MRLGIADKIFVEFDLDSAPDADDPSRTASPPPAAAAPLKPPLVPKTVLDPGGTVSPTFMRSASFSDVSAFPSSIAQYSSGVPSPRGSFVQTGLQVEEPWNMGRRVGQSESTMHASSQAAAAVAPQSSARTSRSSDQPRGSRGSRVRLPRQRKTICTYAFLWPVHNPALLGTEGLSESMASLPSGLSYDPPSGSPLSGLPSWLYGLHSVRYNPGPDWIEPSEQESFQVTRGVVILLYKSVPRLSLGH